MTSYTTSEVIDAVYDCFSDNSEASNLGQREILAKETFGDVHLELQSLFIPSVSGNDGQLISKTKTISKIQIGQVEGGIVYTNVLGIDAVKHNSSALNGMFVYHLNPSDGKKSAVLKMGGLVYHMPLNGTLSRVEEHLIEKPEYGPVSPFKATFISLLGSSDPAMSRKVTKEAVYEYEVVPYIVSFIQIELKKLPSYRV